MAKKPYMTSDDLIDAVKRTISVPLTQVTFSNTDILEFASEELFLSQVPSILQYHEEYFVTDKVIPLEDNVSAYDIPDRAIGMKLRDLYYLDSNGNLFEMTNVGPSNQDVFKNTGNGQTPRNYYVQGNEIVLVPDVKTASGSLLMKYYLRPNSLVENARAAVSNSFVKTILVVNENLVAGNTIVVGSNTLTAGTDFVIGATSTGTAANLATAINNLTGITATSVSSELSVLYKTRSLEFSTNNASAIDIDSRIGIRCDSIPEHFADGLIVDFLQTKGGHNTLKLNVTLGTSSVTSDAVYFEASDVPTKFVIGDYVCEQYESIIPQIPNDLHTLLVQKTCTRILEALGDSQGAQTQNAKVSDLEARQAVIIDNRTEGSPRKVFNKHSLLRYGKSRRRSF